MGEFTERPGQTEPQELPELRARPQTPIHKDMKPESPQIKTQVLQAKVKKTKTNPGFAKIMATGVAMSAAGSSETTASPTVVPIGM